MSGSSIPSGVRFFAPGTPAPQGSKVRTRYGMRESSKRVGPWREAVEATATSTMDDLHMFGPLPAPYRVVIEFVIKRPKTTRHKVPVAPTVGDLDKLTRSTNDALTTAGIIEDDRFIVHATQEKRWALPGETAGALISITTETES